MASLFFWGMTVLFATFILGFGMIKPECIGGVGFEIDRFSDAYALSWVTFATVVRIII
jgi:hypothetical protein